MTLQRTLHRRKARQRAKAAKAYERRRFAALTPEQQASETRFKDNIRWLFGESQRVQTEALRAARHDLDYLAGSVWPQAVTDARFERGATIRIKPPQRYAVTDGQMRAFTRDQNLDTSLRRGAIELHKPPTQDA